MYMYILWQLLLCSIDFGTVNILLVSLLNFLQENRQRVIQEEKRLKREAAKKAADEVKRAKLAAKGQTMVEEEPKADDTNIMDNLLKDIRTGTTLRSTNRKTLRNRKTSHLNSDDMQKLNRIVREASVSPRTAKSDNNDRKFFSDNPLDKVIQESFKATAEEPSGSSTSAAACGVKMNQAGLENESPEDPKPTTLPEDVTPATPPEEHKATAPPEDNKATAPPEEYKATAPPEEHKATAPPEDYKATAPPEEHKATAPPEEHKATAPPEEHKATAPPEDYKATAPPEEHKATAPPEEHKATAPPEEHKATATPEEHKATAPPEEHKATAPPEEHKATATPEEHKATAPPEEHKATAPPEEHKATALLENTANCTDDMKAAELVESSEQLNGHSEHSSPSLHPPPPSSEDIVHHTEPEISSVQAGTAAIAPANAKPQLHTAASTRPENQGSNVSTSNASTLSESPAVPTAEDNVRMEYDSLDSASSLPSANAIQHEPCLQQVAESEETALTSKPSDITLNLADNLNGSTSPVKVLSPVESVSSPGSMASPVGSPLGNGTESGFSSPESSLATKKVQYVNLGCVISV